MNGPDAPTTRPSYRSASFQTALWLVSLFWISAIGLNALSEYESFIAPVLTDMHITDVEPHADGVYLTGDVRKRRNCDFVQLAIFTGDRNDPEARRETLHMAMRPRNLSASITGLQSWGPVDVLAPQFVAGPDLFISVTHSCNAFMPTRGVYLVVPAAAVFSSMSTSATQMNLDKVIPAR